MGAAGSVPGGVFDGLDDATIESLEAKYNQLKGKAKEGENPNLAVTFDQAVAEVGLNYLRFNLFAKVGHVHCDHFMGIYYFLTRKLGAPDTCCPPRRFSQMLGHALLSSTAGSAWRFASWFADQSMFLRPSLFSRVLYLPLVLIIPLLFLGAQQLPCRRRRQQVL